MSETIMIYTDGACSRNPGPGGYGVIIVRHGETSELSGGFRNTTNNRMEVLAAIEGLKALNGDREATVTIYSDSRYLVDMFNGGYAAKWRANGWKLASRKPALNCDLWGELLDLTANRPVRFEWVRGHSEHRENERCDALAVEARLQESLPSDEGYEDASAPPEPQQLSLFGLLGIALLLAAGCSDPTVPFKKKMVEGEEERKMLAARIEEVVQERTTLAEELVRERHTIDVLRVELDGLQALFDERERRLSERDQMVASSSQKVAIAQQLVETAQRHLADMRETYGGQSNLIARAKAYTTGLKNELAARDRLLKEKDRVIREHLEVIEERNGEIAQLRSGKAGSGASTEKRKGLAGPTPVGGGSFDRKVRRLGE